MTSKPDLYPLVISYNDNSAKGGSYLMVQYLRHYFLRPAGGCACLLPWCLFRSRAASRRANSFRAVTGGSTGGPSRL